MRRKAILVIALLLPACAGPPDMTREQSLAETNRIYNAASPEQVARAAEIVLRHSDPPDFTITHSSIGFKAVRHGIIYTVLNAAHERDTWTFSVMPAENGGTRASIQVDSDYSMVLGFGSNPGSKPTPLDYRMFWARVEFVLGLRNEWADCNNAWRLTNRPQSEGKIFLCSLLHDGRNAPPPPRLN